MFWERNKAICYPLNTCIENRRRITFYYFSCCEWPTMRYLSKHKGKKLKICINVSWDPLEWLIFRGTVLQWKAHLWKLVMSNQRCQTKGHCSRLHYWTCHSNHRIPTPSTNSRQAPLPGFRSGDGGLPLRVSQSSQLVYTILLLWKCFHLKDAAVQHQGRLRWRSLGGMQLSGWCMLICNPTANSWSWNKAKCRKN